VSKALDAEPLQVVVLEDLKDLAVNIIFRHQLLVTLHPVPKLAGTPCQEVLHILHVPVGLQQQRVSGSPCVDARRRGAGAAHATGQSSPGCTGRRRARTRCQGLLPLKITRLLLIVDSAPLKDGSCPSYDMGRLAVAAGRPRALRWRRHAPQAPRIALAGAAANLFAPLAIFRSAHGDATVLLHT
jgi:hypothetical protein